MMPKPFGIRELMARVKALLRRSENTQPAPELIKVPLPRPEQATGGQG